MTKFQIEKIDQQFKKELEEIALDNTKISKYKPSIRRLTIAIRRHSLWPTMKQDIKITPLEDDRGRNVE